MNVTSLITVDYENKSNWTLGENKPNSNPIKANLVRLWRVYPPLAGRIQNVERLLASEQIAAIILEFIDHEL